MLKNLTVSKLNLYIKSVVESDFELMNITVEGEVSSLTKHFSGHFYFVLKDESSSIKAVMFASNARSINFDLKNGDKVLIHGYIGVYDKQGTYQLYCRKIEPYGEGQYLLQLAALKEKLTKEGIFDKVKKEINPLPKRIALLTALNGAAVADYTSTLLSRFNTEIYIFPCLVQGSDAPESIIEAIEETKKFDFDLIVLTRGGGSKEDLRCFNDECLVRALYALEVPLITAVGHQIDTTLIDYVADKVCITPTDAAMNSSISKNDIRLIVDNALNQTTTLYIHKLQNLLNKIKYLEKTCLTYSPANRIYQNIIKVDNIRKRINVNFVYKLNDYVFSLNRINERYYQASLNKLNNLNKQISDLKLRLSYLDPDKKLTKGYSYVEVNNKPLKSVKEVKINQDIKLTINDGYIEARIIKIKEK